MVPFGGWEMPLAYPSGTMAEHRACREDAVAFDVSHLGTVRVEGPRRSTTCSIRSATTCADHRGSAAAVHPSARRDRSVTDDIIVWWVDEERFDVMPNASNTSRVVAAIGGTT
jgi:aminomethyltransferase